MEGPFRSEVSAHFRCSGRAFSWTAVLRLVVGAHTEKIAAVGVIQLYFEKPFRVKIRV